MKNVAVLTSGGDAPGMNAAVRAVVRTGNYYGLKVYGVEKGYSGLIEGKLELMDNGSVSDILQRGGTILKTARSEEFRTEEGLNRAIEVLKLFDIEALVVIGGDGSFKGALELHKRGIKTIGLPGTIDNDLGYTDYTIGFHTAITTVTDAVSKLRDTSSSHERVFVVEVMGRNCGDIALYAGICSGAEHVLVPEVEFDIKAVAESVKSGMLKGKSHHIILLAEGITNPYELTKEIEELSGVPTRLAVIGHLQRGGSPTTFDRMLATRMGAEAIELLCKEQSGLAVGIRGNEMTHTELDDAISRIDRLNMQLYELADILAR